jgi:hypothetical protein
MKLSLLAKSCLTPGLVALITNLIKSSDDPPPKKNLPEGPEWEWLEEYWGGKTFEIYRIPLPKNRPHNNFCYLSNYIYKNHDSILFAVEIVEAKKDKDHGPILLNPGNFDLP